MAEETVEQKRKHFGLSALLVTAILALLPAACGPERDPVSIEAQARPATAQTAR
ncbi:MAG TPA: hypothetical protein VFR31_05195 [Thermoanaerobaculia bacterium]|nr:hypothetical protein [Thermoanaerobaculia bacterium]